MSNMSFMTLILCCHPTLVEARKAGQGKVVAVLLMASRQKRWSMLPLRHLVQACRERACRTSDSPETQRDARSSASAATQKQRLTNVARSGESWSQQKEVVRQHSEYAGRLGSEWDCRCVIVKSHDDLRQDQLAAELLFLFDRFVFLSMQTL